MWVSHRRLVIEDIRMNSSKPFSFLTIRVLVAHAKNPGSVARNIAEITAERHTASVGYIEVVSVYSEILYSE
jgi:hypothetical protein